MGPLQGPAVSLKDAEISLSVGLFSLVNFPKRTLFRLPSGFLHSEKGWSGRRKRMSLVQNIDFHLIPLFSVQPLTPVPNVPEHRSFLI